MNSWHMVHLGSRAVGGAGLVVCEAASVSPEGRITPHDAGIWNDAQVASMKPVMEFVRAQGCVPAIQLAHAGRKASSARPWEGGKALDGDQGGWSTVAPSAVPYSVDRPAPSALDESGLDKIRSDFQSATLRAVKAGFEVVEVHAAHGYLLHSFLSPLSNQRDDSYGGNLENRMRFPLEIVRIVRESWPDERPLFVRISASDWAEGGWDLKQSLRFGEELKRLDVDLVDCSSGGLVSHQKIITGRGYQVPFAQALRATGIATAAVGEITSAAQAETILRTEQADLVLLARELLRDPYWPLRAQKELRAEKDVPSQYERAW